MCQNVLSALVPYHIDSRHSQTLRQISLVSCRLDDQGVDRLFSTLRANQSQAALQVLSLKDNLLTATAVIKHICPFLESHLTMSSEFEHLILDGNPKVGAQGFA